MWKEHAERSWEMFDEAGVEVKFYDNTTTGI
jgi:hypothetical protein